LEEDLENSKAAKYGVEKVCKSLQEKVNNVDLMLRLQLLELKLIKINLKH